MNKRVPIARYITLSSWLKGIFNESVHKITLDAGLGCPNRDGALGTDGCIYCNANGSGTSAYRAGLSIRMQLEAGLGKLTRRYKCRKFIAYFQSYSNTYGNLPDLAELYNTAANFPEVVGLAIGTRPDCVPEEVLAVVKQAAGDKLVWLEYGLQSIHDRTLALINRRHSSAAFMDAVRRTKDAGIACVAHLILGLPGESLDDMIATAAAVAHSGVQGVKLHPLYVVKGTRLAEMYKEGEYSPLTLDRFIEAVIAVLERLPRSVVIHRLTSDPHPKELVAPGWMPDKRGVLTALNNALDVGDIYQGSKAKK